MKGAHAIAEGQVHRSPPIEAEGLTRVVMMATVLNSSTENEERCISKSISLLSQPR
jgi:hypothetical protein